MSGVSTALINRRDEVQRKQDEATLQKRRERCERIDGLRVDRTAVSKLVMPLLSPEGHAAEERLIPLRHGVTMSERMSAYRAFSLAKI